MNVILAVFKDTVLYVLHTLAHNSPALALGVLVAAAMKVYIDGDKMKDWLMRRSAVSIPATVAFGAFTPFCACGTMAVVLSMLATALPWGPVMAFLTSSPLMSPEGFVMISGIISPTFAIALAVASVLVGIGSGYGTHLIEKKTHFLDNQLRFAEAEAASTPQGCGCSAPGGGSLKAAEANCCYAECSEENDETPSGCGCGAVALAYPAQPHTVGSTLKKAKLDQVLLAVWDVGIKKILPYFMLFAAIGYLINRLVPSTWISALFGAHNVFAVPLAAIVGLPLYINGDSSIPLINSLMQSGVSGGAMLAFMITGPGTSAGVLAGIATIMKKRAIALYTAWLLAGAILLGYAYDLLLPLIGR